MGGYAVKSFSRALISECAQEMSKLGMVIPMGFEGATAAYNGRKLRGFRTNR